MFDPSTVLSYWSCGSCVCNKRLVSGIDDEGTVASQVDDEIPVFSSSEIHRIDRPLLSSKTKASLQDTSPRKRTHRFNEMAPLSEDMKMKLGFVPNQVHMLSSISSRLNKFRDHMARVAKPTSEDFLRGVHIEGVFDFFTFENKRVRVRQLHAKLFHHRMKRDNNSDGGLSDSSSASISSRNSSRASTESIATNNTDPNEAVQIGQEALARWGILVGKLVHDKVLDIRVVAARAVHKKKYNTPMRRGQFFDDVRERSRIVAKQAWDIAGHIVKEREDLRDGDWKKDNLLSHLFGFSYFDNLCLLANAARKMFAVQPSLVEVPVPCRVFGDIHGQFRDLLLLFFAFGNPVEVDAPNFIFNGDFVDRGAHQIEVIGLLLALKVLLPEKVFLIRGNHEDRQMNRRYGFFDECQSRIGEEFGELMFSTIHNVFDQLPVAGLIAERVLVLHGGIGDGHWTLDDIRSIKRPLRDEGLAEPWISNILWSDPIEDDRGNMDVFGVHESPRGGVTTRFGWNVTEAFCARNGVSLIVRSHQCKRAGMGFDVMHDDHLICVFSARDYDHHGNDGCVLLFRDCMETPGLLVVRPQVLRSATKTVKEARAHTSDFV